MVVSLAEVREMRGIRRAELEVEARSELAVYRSDLEEEIDPKLRRGVATFTYDWHRYPSPALHRLYEEWFYETADALVSELFEEYTRHGWAVSITSYPFRVPSSAGEPQLKDCEIEIIFDEPAKPNSPGPKFLDNWSLAGNDEEIEDCGSCCSRHLYPTG